MLTINNNSGFTMTYVREWYKYGSRAPGQEWPIRIENGQTVQVISIAPSLGSVSGFVIYATGSEEVTYAFSAPSVGDNKLGVGTGGKEVWENMESHDYKPFRVILTLGSTKVYFDCLATGGGVNNAQVRSST